jgi:hypothetical protein
MKDPQNPNTIMYTPEMVPDPAVTLTSKVGERYAEQIDLLLRGEQSDSALTTTSDTDGGEFDVRSSLTTTSQSFHQKFGISQQEAIELLKERINKDGLCAYSIKPGVTEESCCSIVVPVLTVGGNMCNVDVNLLLNDNNSVMVSTVVHKTWKEYSAQQQVNHTKRRCHHRRSGTNSYSVMTTMMKYNALFNSESTASGVRTDFIGRISRTNDGTFIFFYLMDFSVAIVSDGTFKSVLDNFILKAIEIKRDFAAKEALIACARQA